MTQPFDRLAAVGVIPVVTVERAEDALPVCEALARGGLPAAEITFRTDAAAEAIARVAAAMPDFLVGAGTVLTVEQAERAIRAGAQFLVSPGCPAAVAEHCLVRGYPFLPGVATATEITAALSYGYRHQKFFPAESLGGLGMLKALAAPFPRVRFMPTGGISAALAPQYLAKPFVFACGGSYMVGGDLIAARRFDEIERLARETADAVREVRHG